MSNLKFLILEIEGEKTTWPVKPINEKEGIYKFSSTKGEDAKHILVVNTNESGKYETRSYVLDEVKIENGFVFAHINSLGTIHRIELGKFEGLS